MEHYFSSVGEVTDRIREWIAAEYPDAEIEFSPTGRPVDKPTVCAWLVAVGELPELRSDDPDLKFSMRYLVCTRSDDAVEADEMLATLVFSAMRRDEFDVALESPDYRLWSLLEVSPRPAFSLGAKMRQSRRREPAPLVREPVRFGVATALGGRASVQVTDDVTIDGVYTRLHGAVIGPGDQPIAGARLELPRLDLRTRADTKGRFRFPPTICASDRQPLVVSAKRQQMSFEVDVSQTKSLVITFQPPEWKED